MEISELIDTVNILDYVSQYVELEQRGNEYWGLSPFTNERTPSFSLTPPRYFYDYSAGFGGTVYEFAKRYHNLNDAQTIRELEKYTGINTQSQVNTKRLAAAVCCRKYSKKQQKNKEAKPIILAKDYMDRFDVDKDKLSAWEREGISKETMRDFNVKYDYFSDRIVYPIYDNRGNLVNVGGRTLDPEYKEKGLRKYTYFYSWGGSMQVIYGAYQNREYITQQNEIILFEGCKSVLLAYTWGIKNCGALLTSHLNFYQMKLLIQYGVRVVFALDKEVDITKDKNIQKLSHYNNVYYLSDDSDLLNEKDAPVDQGQEVFELLYKNKRKLRRGGFGAG